MFTHQTLFLNTSLPFYLKSSIRIYRQIALIQRVLLSLILLVVKVHCSLPRKRHWKTKSSVKNSILLVSISKKMLSSATDNTLMLASIQGYLFDHGISSPSGNAHWSRDVLNKLLNNGKYTKGIITFEEYCNVYFLKGENCRNPNQAKVVNTDAKSDQRRTGVGVCSNQREVFSSCE